MRILMCTDGTPASENALNFGAPLARAAQAEVTLLGLVAAETDPKVREALARAQNLFPAPVEAKIRRGRLAQEILTEVEGGAYELIVVGSRGRRGLERLAFGSVAARLAQYAPIPVLIVKGTPRPAVKRVLACTSGDVRGERVARWGGQIARWLNAEITVLHVMSQIALSPKAKFDELTESAEEALARGTREGQHLARELELMRGQTEAAPAEMRPKLRHGLVVEEITAEAEEGDYDLVAIGGHEAPAFPGNWDGLEYLLEDVADQVIMALQRPVLVVKGK
jgi:nucleotide-binding universal stress UspA family protein